MQLYREEMMAAVTSTQCDCLVHELMRDGWVEMSYSAFSQPFDVFPNSKLQSA